MVKARTKRSPLKLSQERITSKLAECDFFLRQMRQSREPQEFAYHMSAFLTAFSSFTQLALLRKHPRGFEKALERLRKNSVVDRLLDYRDVEVHREGIRIWGYDPSLRANPRFRVGIWGDLLVTAPHRSRSRDGSRFESRLPPRYGGGMLRALERITPTHDLTTSSFVFEGSGLDVFELCTAGVEALRSLCD